MAVEINELVTSREVTIGTSPSATLKYYIHGTDDESVALVTLDGATTYFYQGMIRQSLGVKPIGDPTVSLGWYGDVKYGKPNPSNSPSETGDMHESFSTSGGTQTIMQSYSTTPYALTGETAPDFKNAIQVTGDGENQTVQGVSVTSPIYTFSETHYMEYDDVTIPYRGKIYELTGKTNQSWFKGLKTGECLFLGATGSVRGDNVDWEITFNFAASPNENDLEIGDITGISKEGWQYLWVRYKKELDGDNNLISVPKSVYVETVYESGDFSELGIGGGS